MTRIRAVSLGMASGFVIAAGFLPGGLDAGRIFLRDWYPSTSAPAYVYLLTAPLGKLPWPLGYMTLTALTMAALLWAAQVFETRGWLALAAAPVVYVFWLGQIDSLVIVGLGLAWLIIQERASVWWGGIAILLLLIKPQVGTGITLYLIWHLGQRNTILDWWKAALPALFILTFSWLLWGSWGGEWLTNAARHGNTYLVGTENMGLGLFALPVLLFWCCPEFKPEKRFRLFLVGTMLVSPYLQHYSYATLFVVAGSPLLVLVSWLAVFLRLQTGIIWFLLWIPLMMLALELYRDHDRERGRLWRSLLAT